MIPALPRRSRAGTGVVLALLVVALTALSGARPAAAESPTTEGGPLEVVLTSITPGQVPSKGPIVLSGRVTNQSTEVWRDVNVSAFVSTTPMTTSAELVQAAAQPYAANVGDRLTSEHAYVGIGDLAPGAETSFSLRVPRDEIPIPDEPGVYWIGAHALGTNDEGRDDTADGRARAFIPLVAPDTPTVPISVVVPFRAEVRRDTDLRLRDPDAWNSALSDSGRLERLLALSEDARDAPFTALVDPAVLDAIDTVARGPMITAPTSTPAPTPSPSPSASAGAGQRASEPPVAGPDAARAASWLRRFAELTMRVRVLGLGYADPDVTALARRAPSLLETAGAEADSVFARFGIVAARAAAPTDGRISDKALDDLDPSTTVVLDQAGVTLDQTDDQTGTPTLVRSVRGQTLALADPGAADGGPGPTPATDALAMRQRILSEAALRSLDGDPNPLVVSLPDDWDPGSDWRSADFFGGLTRSWTRLEPLGSSDVVAPGVLYPASARRAQLDERQVDAVRAVARAGRVYADALTEPGNLAEAFRRLALEGASVHARGSLTSVRQADEEVRNVRDRLAGIRVVGSSFVTMSGGSGSFVVTLVNDLARPVRVGLSATTSNPALRISAPGKAVVLPAGQRTTVRVRASSDETGVRAVVLSPVTQDGARVGTPIRFTVRSSKVSSLVWGVLAGAFALLVVTIVRRAVKRGLHRDTTPPRPVRD